MASNQKVKGRRHFGQGRRGIRSLIGHDFRRLISAVKRDEMPPPAAVYSHLVVHRRHASYPLDSGINSTKYFAPSSIMKSSVPVRRLLKLAGGANFSRLAAGEFIAEGGAGFLGLAF